MCRRATPLAEVAESFILIVTVTGEPDVATIELDRDPSPVNR